MSARQATKKSDAVSPPYHLLAGLLSYLIPGLGQIYQGRTGKGFLFLICVYSLFGYGVYLGAAANVFIPDASKLPKVTFNILGDARELEGTGKALYNRPQYCGQFWVGIAAWPAIWQYHRYNGQPDGQDRYLGRLQRQLSESDLNEKQTNGDKTWDLAWVFTVIAGVLNIMVIYDAVAGPAFRSPARAADSENEPTHAKPAAAVIP